MINLENHLGRIIISSEFFASLVGQAASECFGVIGMVNSTAGQELRFAITRQDTPDKGVRVRNVAGGLVIDLHIAVIYGVNISEVVKSIISKVRYTVEDATGLSVAKVNVFVDEMRYED